MIEIKNVQGTQGTVQETEFNIDTVYVRSNIIRVETEDFVGWRYDEIQYDYREWATIQEREISELKNELAFLKMNE